MKENFLRIIYILICVIIASVSYYYIDDVVSSGKPFDKFSYIGTVVTTIGFIVAIFEVLHSVYISKSIQSQSQELLTKVKEVENASSMSDCISAVDETNKHVMNENYVASLSTFQGFRKLYVKLGLDPFENKVLLNQVEKLMIKSTRVTTASPLSKPQKDKLIDDILIIKDLLEQSNPVNGSK